MPIYEYKCLDCGRLTSVFVKSINGEVAATCRHCSGANLSRAVSGFAYHKSEQTILAEYGSEPKRLEDYRDPRQIGRWVERRFKDMGEDLPDQTRRMIDAAREGELPPPLTD